MFENIRLSFQGIWSHKLRSFLTMLGIIIGIAAIIAIVSTIEGTNELIKQNMMGNNRHTVQVQLSQDDYTYEISTWNPSPEGVPLFDEDTRQEILQIPNVLRAAFYQVRSEYNSVVFYNKQSLSSCTVLGIDQYYFGTAGYQIMQGREIIQEDSKKKRQVAVIDESVLRTLFPDEDPIGKTIEIYGEPFTVVGVCTQVGQSELVINSEEEYWTYYQGGSSSGNIYIPKGVWGTIYKFDEAQNLVLQASGADEMAAAGKAAANIMNQNMNVSDSSITYRSEDLMQQAKQLQDMQSSTNSMLIWVACISLLVGGIGVMNIMLVSVTERTKEIGLKKAIGAKKGRILGQFLTEAAILTSMGGLLGVAAGIGLAEVISKMSSTPVAINGTSIVVSVGFSTLIGVVFGLLPSISAANLNPIEALRHE